MLGGERVPQLEVGATFPHLAVYLSDPDGNDLELAWDRPYEEWPRYGADAPSADRPLELDELLAAR